MSEDDSLRLNNSPEDSSTEPKPAEIQPIQVMPSYRFQSLTDPLTGDPKTIFNSPQVSGLPYRFATPLKAPDLHAPLEQPQSDKVQSPTLPPTTPRPSVYRFALPSDQVFDRATEVDTDVTTEAQRRSLPKGLGILVLLVSPFVSLLGLSSLALVSSAPNTTVSTSNPSENQFDYSPLLQRAEELVKRNELRVALRLISNIPQASEKRNQISADLLQRAKDAYPRNLDMAVYIASNVPTGTPSFDEARSLVAGWSDQLNRLRAAEFAVSQQQWDEAGQQLDALKDTPIARSDRYTQLLKAVQQKRLG